jgi:predicted ATPase
LKSQLSRKTIAAKFRSLLERLGRDSHLFDNIGIRSFGRGNGAPFEVQVEVDGVPLSLSNVGYGVSQVLPILVEVLARSKNSIFHIQQPEVHLHPRAQAALGELIYLLAVEEEKRFVIETHSDFLIDRFRSMIKEKGGDGYAGNSSVIFFHREKGHNVAQELLLSEEGEYPIDQPSTFRDFFINEEMRSLSL